MTANTAKVRYAVVGLGWFGQAAILPAFANAADNSELTALFSDDAVKRRELGAQYGVPAYPYDDYDAVLGRGDVDAIYIALPNALHRGYTVRAARAGVHVLCEKPMADTANACRAMIDACASAGVKLMIGYRLHFEEANLRAIEVVSSGALGEPRLFSSVFTQQVGEGNTRLDADLGGGPLEDIGIYCVNAARYLFRAEPLEVSALAADGRDERFRKVHEAVSATLRFPGDRLATFTCSFGAAKVSTYRVLGTEGDLLMEPAYPWNDYIKQVVTVDGKSKEQTFRKRDQVAAEILYFSECVRTGREPEPSGREGLADLRVIEALHRSIREGRSVKLEPFAVRQRPTPEQEIERSPAKPPELVHAAPPSAGG